MTEITITRTSDRTRILTFDDHISVVVLFGSHHTFLCDTHLGPESMDLVKKYLLDEPGTRDLIIFNSHSDWDHIWGNCAFPDSLIIGHIMCRKRMEERGKFDLSRLSHLTRGHVTLKSPNLTFEKEVCFEDDDVEFIHAAGHTIDSSLCFDRKEKILYIGDLVEDPIPYLDYDHLDQYINTLEMLLLFPAEIMISAHSGIISHDLIRRNMVYIRAVMDGETIDTSSLGPYQAVHQTNLNTLLMFRFEKQAHELLKNKYKFSSFWSIPPDLEKMNTNELKKLMTEFLAELENES